MGRPRKTAVIETAAAPETTESHEPPAIDVANAAVATLEARVVGLLDQNEQLKADLEVAKLENEGLKREMATGAGGKTVGRDVPFDSSRQYRVRDNVNVLVGAIGARLSYEADTKIKDPWVLERLHEHGVALLLDE